MKRRALTRLARAEARANGISRPGSAVLKLAKAEVVKAAYHEAGHVVIGRHLMGETPRLATIERGSENIDSPTHGFVRWGFHQAPEVTAELLKQRSAPQDLMRSSAVRWVQTQLAGYAVEETFGFSEEPFDLFTAWDEDQDGDVILAFDELAPFEKREGKRWVWMDSIWSQTKALVARHDIRNAVKRIAETLLDTPTLEEDVLRRLLAEVIVDLSHFSTISKRGSRESATAGRRARPRRRRDIERKN